MVLIAVLSIGHAGRPFYPVSQSLSKPPYSGLELSFYCRQCTVKAMAVHVTFFAQIWTHCLNIDRCWHTHVVIHSASLNVAGMHWHSFQIRIVCHCRWTQNLSGSCGYTPSTSYVVLLHGVLAHKNSWDYHRRLVRFCVDRLSVACHHSWVLKKALLILKFISLLLLFPLFLSTVGGHGLSWKGDRLLTGYCLKLVSLYLACMRVTASICEYMNTQHSSCSVYIELFRTTKSSFYTMSCSTVITLLWPWIWS